MILKVLAEKPGEVVTRDDQLEKVWGYEVYP
jgi:DNA-binding winged helix-turn-helix (wHTH) protein